MEAFKEEIVALVGKIVAPENYGEFARGKVLPELSSRKSAGEDAIVSELLKYGREGMITVMSMVKSLLWENEYILKRWMGVVVANVFKRGDRASQ